MSGFVSGSRLQDLESIRILYYNLSPFLKAQHCIESPFRCLVGGTGMDAVFGKGLKEPRLFQCFLPVIGYNSIIQGSF